MNQTSLTLNWTDNSDNEGGFRVFRDGSNVSDDLPADKITYNDSGLTPNKTYSYYVQAYNGAGTANSSSINCTTLPDDPTGVGHSGNAIDSITWSWTAPGDGATYYTADGTDVGNVTSWTEGSLNANTQYTRTVKACNASGCSPGVAVSAYTDIAVPGVPEAGAVTQTSIEVRSSNPPGSWPGQTAIEIKNNDTGLTSGWQANNNYWLDDNNGSGLACGTSYSYSIRARNGDPTGWSFLSLSKSTAACPDTTAPTFTSFTVDNSVCSKLTATVSGAADADSGLDASPYRFSRSRNPPTRAQFSKNTK